jgi:hypothetical protein
MAFALIVAVALLVALPAICQPGANAGGPIAGGGMGMGMGPGGPPSVVMVVAAQGVYVAMGPQIYRLDPETLKVLAKGELPRPEPPDGAGPPPNQ